MFANRKLVKGIVKQLADMQSNGWERRTWCDKCVTDESMRYLTFKFYSAKEADIVAQALQLQLAQQGYTNKVRRTSVESDYWKRTSGGEYVRVKALFE